MSQFNNSKVEKSDYPSDDEELTIADFVGALEDIAEVAPELMEYILTYYPPELMIHMSEAACQRLEALKKSSSNQESGALPNS